MTSLKYYKNLHVVKLDRRYKLYPQFKYRVSFDTQQADGWDQWLRVNRWLERTWGAEYIWHRTGSRSWCLEYRTAIPKNKYFRQLYLRSEEDLTMMLLVVGG